MSSETWNVGWMFRASSSIGSFRYSFECEGTTETGTELYAYHMLVITNLVDRGIEVYMTSYNLTWEPYVIG